MKKMTIKLTKRALRAFEYFAQCQDEKRMPEIPFAADGYSAAECFYARETYGDQLPCREPVLLARALNGKAWHGLTVTMCAEDYLGRILFASDLKRYPESVRGEILSRAAQLALERIGFVPTFVKTGEDFSTIEL